MKIKIREEIKNIKDEIYTIRRHFHKYPELSFKEFNTAETISQHLNNLGISHKKVSEKLE